MLIVGVNGNTTWKVNLIIFAPNWDSKKQQLIQSGADKRMVIEKIIIKITIIINNLFLNCYLKHK